MGWVSILIEGILSIAKSLFGTDKPIKTTVTHPKPALEVDDGKTDEERLNDLGL